MTKKKDTFLILGGEPFLFIEDLLQLVKNIKILKNDAKIFITTSLPYTFVSMKKEVNEIMDIIDGLNVSIHYFESEKNNEILNASSDHNRLEVLEDLLLYKGGKYSNKIRVAFNLVKGFICLGVAIYSMLEYLKGIGCKHVKIQELQDAEENYVSFEKIFKYHKLKSPYYHGCQTKINYIFNGDYDNMEIILKRSCFMTEKTLKANFKDLSKVIFKKVLNKQTSLKIIYENGLVFNSWLKEKKDVR